MVNECDWAYLQTLRTTRAPHEPMPSLAELLDFLSTDEQENIWLVLDVKVRVDATLLIRTARGALTDLSRRLMTTRKKCWRRPPRLSPQRRHHPGLGMRGYLLAAGMYVCLLQPLLLSPQPPSKPTSCEAPPFIVYTKLTQRLNP